MVFVPVFSSNFSFGFSRFSCFPLSRKYMDVFAGDLLFCVASNDLRVPDVLAQRTREAKMCRRPSTHRSVSEERAQLVTAR